MTTINTALTTSAACAVQELAKIANNPRLTEEDREHVCQVMADICERYGLVIPEVPGTGRKPRVINYASELDMATTEDVFETLTARGYSQTRMRRLSAAQAYELLRYDFAAEQLYCQVSDDVDDSDTYRIRD